MPTKNIQIVSVSPSGTFSGVITYDSGGTVSSFTDDNGGGSILGSGGTFDGSTFTNLGVTSLGTITDSLSPPFTIATNSLLSSGDFGSTTITTTISDGPCFNEGTKILCLFNNEDNYVPIENLRKGDIVKTYKYGYRRIDLIGKNYLLNNPDNFTHCMYKMAKTNTNDLIEDLIVTGGHSILVDDLENNKLNEKLFNGQTLKIEDKYLLLAAASDKFEKIVGNDKYTYYHLVLENNGDDKERFGIWANGILTETPSKNFFVQSHFILL